MVVIPHDMITDILSRLPAKPLLRFRCVCKSWRDLVDSKKFIKLHLNKTRESNCHRKLILHDTSGAYSADFDNIVANNVAVLVVAPFLSQTRISCCDGLICTLNSAGEIYIWNPSIKSCLKLPTLGLDGTPFFTLPVAKVSWNSGFGYDVLADDYKLMVLLKIENHLEELLYSRTSVYSLKFNSWREIMPFPYHFNSDSYPGVLASGVVHWLVTEPKSPENQLVGAFDLATEKYHIVKQPNHLRKEVKEQSKLNFGSLEGCLSLICAYRKYVDVWVMKDYGELESWTNIVRIDTSGFSNDSFNTVRTVEYTVSGKELLLEIDMISLVRYDFEKKLAKVVDIRGHKPHDWIYSLQYQESLVQVKIAGPSVPQKEVRNNKKIDQAKKGDKFLSKGFKLVL